MTQEEFETRLRELFMPKDGDREFEKHETEAVNLIKAAVVDTTKLAGGAWDNNVAKDRMVQWEWMVKEISPSDSGE